MSGVPEAIVEEPRCSRSWHSGSLQVNVGVYEQPMERESRMIWLLKTGVRMGLVAAAMTVVVPMTAFAQATKPVIESAPAEAKPVVANTSPTGDENSTDNDTSVQNDQLAKPAVPVVVEVEIQRRFNDLRHELLDERIKLVDWWLDATAIFLTLLGIVAVIAGYLSFKRFREIEAEARQHVMASKQHAEGAQSLVEEIKAKRHEAESLVEKLNAETVGKDPNEAGRAAKSVQANPAASLIDQAIAAAVLLQKQGNIEKAIEKWRAIASTAEGTDNDLAARAWFSIGYLAKTKSPEDSMFANDQAIRLKPDFAEAYNNRGGAKYALERYDAAINDCDQAIKLKPDHVVAYSNRGLSKAALGRYEDAIDDYDEAIRLKPNYAEAYNNRGVAKNALGRKDEARKDLQTALELARNANNAKIVAQAEQKLRNLATDGGS